MNISSSIIINRPLKVVYDTFYKLDHWVKALSDVISVNLIYDDGLNQAFDMTVERPNGQETVAGLRFSEKYRSIQLCQTTPPPLFTKMVGEWTFTSKQDDCTEVLAERIFVPKDISQSVHISEMLTTYLQQNLKAFKNYIENDHVARTL